MRRTTQQAMSIDLGFDARMQSVSAPSRPSALRMWLPPLLLAVLLVWTSLSVPVAATTTTTTSTSSTSASGLSSTNVYTVEAVCTSIATTLLRQASSAYNVDNDLSMEFTAYAAADSVSTAFLTGDYDYGVGITGFSTSQLRKTPQYRAYPMIANAIVPIYNLPESAGTTQLILPVDVFCDIELGNITNWNDTRIQAANPDLVMPDLGITMFQLTIKSGGSQAVSTFCGKISAAYSAKVPASMLPSWPTSSYYAYQGATTSDLLSSLVMDTVGGFATPTLQNVIAIGATYASMQNADGVVVTPTVNAISLNVLELAVGGTLGTTSYDLTDPISPNAWPIVTMLYFLIDIENPITTCATKTAVVEFIVNFYNSDSVRLLATTLNMAIVPELWLSQVSLLSTMQAAIQCQDSTLISTTSTTAGYIQGFGAASALLTAYANYYTDVDTDYTYTFSSTTATLATQRVVAVEVDLAVVNTRQVQDDEIELMLADSAGTFLPAFMAGSVITFTLPTKIKTAWAAWSSTTSTLPKLLPLTINLETAAKIFTAQVTNWTDPALLATSPQLAEWFAAYPTVSTAFTTVVCCTSTTDPLAAGTMLLQSLNQTTTALSSNYSAYFATPISWTDQVAAYPNFFTLIDTEARMSAKASSIQLLGGSTISYRQITVADTDTTSEFQISQTTSAGVTEIVTPEPSNFLECATVGYLTGQLIYPWYIPGVISGCYPLTATLSIGANLVFTGDDCTRGNHSLRLFQWIISTDALSQAALDSGMLRIADIDGVTTAVQAVLDTATCDGETLLITLPKVWSTNNAILGFGLAVCIFAVVMFAASAVILILYRHRTVLRSSSVPFLTLVLLGLTMLAFSIAVWSVSVNDSTCHSFMWLVSLGFSLVFVPFLAKTYRIYMIFSRRQLRVVKMSNKRLLSAVGAILLVEIAVMIVWSQVSPLKPITYTRNISGTYHQATLCSVDGTGMVFVVIETVYKGLLLLAGTVLAFRTRKVSSAFNESSAVAFSIYNVFFSSIIIGLIIYFVDAFEDTLILLMLFLLFWVTYTTWALLFGAKFYLLFSQTEDEAAQASRIDSLQVEKSQGGFSFVSVASMPANMIKGYITALETQLAKARKQLTTVLGTTGQLGLGLGLARRVVSPALGQAADLRHRSPTSPPLAAGPPTSDLPAEEEGDLCEASLLMDGTTDAYDANPNDADASTLIRRTAVPQKRTQLRLSSSISVQTPIPTALDAPVAHSPSAGDSPSEVASVTANEVSVYAASTPGATAAATSSWLSSAVKPSSRAIQAQTRLAAANGR